MQTDEGKQTCIIVDDEIPAHKILEFHIAGIEWLKVIGNCYNAFQAIDLIRAVKPDIVFLDVTMPLMTGFEMLEELPGQQFKVIMVTANPRRDEQLTDPRIIGYFYKPVTGSRFLEIVDKLR